MSLTSTVPLAVPSDFQSSTPCVPFVAVKYRVLLIAVSTWEPIRAHLRGCL